MTPKKLLQFPPRKAPFISQVFARQSEELAHLNFNA